LPAALVVVWVVTSTTAHSFYYPPASAVLQTITGSWLGPFLLQDVVPSLLTLFAGMAAAVAVAVPLGYLIGSVPVLRQVFVPFLDLARSVPVIALIPLFISVLGIGPGTELVVITWACAWPILLNTIEGTRTVPQGFLETADVLHMSRLQRLGFIRLPSAMPNIMAGLTTSVGLGVIAMVAVEMYSSQRGIGFQLVLTQRNFDLAGSYAGAIVAGVIGYLLARAVGSVDRRLLAWHVRTSPLQTMLRDPRRVRG
jgi:ABC-type nitrate/sulfonate/bicarbonate transport system permease component